MSKMVQGEPSKAFQGKWLMRQKSSSGGKELKHFTFSDITSKLYKMGITTIKIFLSVKTVCQGLTYNNMYKMSIQ